MIIPAVAKTSYSEETERVTKLIQTPCCRSRVISQTAKNLQPSPDLLHTLLEPSFMISAMRDCEQ